MMEKRRTAGERTPSTGRTLWLYGYEMIQPHHTQGMTAIQDLLDRVNDEATREDRTWTARLVTEQQATHVLIVSTSPEQDREINRKLEAELKAMGVDCLLTLPMPVRDGSQV
ncbi:hypothetical protein BH23GEM10_BH23GEM10_06650 [soil metagenome]